MADQEGRAAAMPLGHAHKPDTRGFFNPARKPNILLRISREHRPAITEKICAFHNARHIVFQYVGCQLRRIQKYVRHFG